MIRYFSREDDMICSRADIACARLWAHFASRLLFFMPRHASFDDAEMPRSPDLYWPHGDFADEASSSKNRAALPADAAALAR